MKRNNSFIRRIIQMGYDIIRPTRTRRQPTTILWTEDKILNRSFRKTAVATARECLRNGTLAGYALRKHLQFVSNFTFECKHPSKRIRNDITEFAADWLANIDDTERYDFSELADRVETCRVVDGDVLISYVGDGKIQVFEQSELQSPGGDSPQEYGKRWIQGVLVGENGRVLGYNIRRGSNDFFIPSDRAYLLGYFQYLNQYRGISPLASGINSFIDIYEATDYALSKAKLSQMVGLLTKHDKLSDVRAAKKIIEDDLICERRMVHEKIGSELLHLQMDSTDAAEFLTPDTPGGSFQEFITKAIHFALASLDIPYNFFDSSIANFYGNTMSTELFLDTIHKKQNSWIVLMNRLFKWTLADAVYDGKVSLFGTDFETVLKNCRFIGAHYPISELFKNVDGVAKAAELGLIDKAAAAAEFGIPYSEEQKASAAGKNNLNINI